MTEQDNEQIPTTTTQEEITPTSNNEGAEQSTPPVMQKRKLTDEEKREILRRRRLEKIKGQGESRMNKIMYGDSAPTTTPSSSTAVENLESKEEKDSSDNNKKEHLHNNLLLINQKVEEAYSPLFKLHDPKLIEKETREYEQPITIEPSISTHDSLTSAIPNLANWDKEASAKAKPGIFEKLRPLFILILSFMCAISTFYHNEKLHFGAAGLDTLLGYFSQFTPVSVLITFELAIILPGLLSGKSIFSMHTESALDMFLFVKGIWNIVGGSRSDTSANKLFYHHEDHVDDDDDGEDEFVMVDSELPNQSSYFHVMIKSKKGFLGKGKEEIVSFKPTHRGVYTIKVKNTNVVGGFGLEFYVDIRIGKKRIDHNFVNKTKTKKEIPVLTRTSNDDHDFHEVDHSDLISKDKKTLQSLKLLKASDSWEIRIDLADPYSPFFKYLTQIGKDEIEIDLISGVTLGLGSVYYQVDVFEEFEQMVFLEDTLSQQTGGLGEVKTQLSHIGAYKLFIENITYVSGLSNIPGITASSSNYNFDVTVLSGFFNQFKENISPITYSSSGKNDIFKQLIQYFELYEEPFENISQAEEKPSSLYITDTFPCYPSLIPMDFIVKLQHHAIAHRPTLFSQGPLKFRILIGYIPESKWEVVICEHILNLGEKLINSMNVKDGDLIRDIVNEIKAGIIKIPNKSDEIIFKINFLKFDSKYLQIEIEEYYSNACVMADDLNRLEDEFTRVLQTRHILSDISLENIKQLKQKSENYYLKSTKLNELIEEASAHIVKMDNEQSTKTELKEKLKYLEDKVLSPISNATSSFSNDLFVRNCAKVESEQELNRIYQDVIDFRKRARKVVESLGTKGDTQIEMKKLDMYITTIRQQRDLQLEFTNHLESARQEKALTDLKIFWHEKGKLLIGDSKLRYDECVHQIEEELRKIELEKALELERKQKELEAKKKKAEEERRKKEDDEKKRREEEQKRIEEERKKAEEEKRRKEDEERKKKEHAIIEEQQLEESPKVVEAPTPTVLETSVVETSPKISSPSTSSPSDDASLSQDNTPSIIVESSEDASNTLHIGTEEEKDSTDVVLTDQDELSSNTVSSHSQNDTLAEPSHKKRSSSTKKKKKHSEDQIVEEVGDLVIERKKKSDKKKKPKKKPEAPKSIIEMFPEAHSDSSFPTLNLSIEDSSHDNTSNSIEVIHTESPKKSIELKHEDRPNSVTVTNYGNDQANEQFETPTEVVQSLRENVKQLITLASQRSQSAITTYTDNNDEVYFKFNCTNERPFEEYMERICVSIENLLLDHRLEKKAFLTNKPYKESPVTIMKGLSPQGDAIVKEFNKFIDVSGIKKKLPNDVHKDSNLAHLLVQFCFHKDVMTTLILQLTHFSTLSYLKKYYDPTTSLLLNTSYRDELSATIELLKQLKLTFKFFDQYH
ncbi:predicted protein [Naegleria gruberi]|uniref:Predicted protein n=1 Tax=Naegleria gruberi TaxID=5762 RepID=D2VYU6_NAEGR|nr:uncharacterized protein NAEGRDRAFT_81747 [Naegleria gruberi]EFC38018.1 predicted protein [Naegleria gruberi]|eukprot:XP_002670762.1 predicted protein [Naegleria gruberi strain NEG-M]